MCGAANSFFHDQMMKCEVTFGGRHTLDEESSSTLSVRKKPCGAPFDTCARFGFPSGNRIVCTKYETMVARNNGVWGGETAHMVESVLNGKNGFFVFSFFFLLLKILFFFV